MGPQEIHGAGANRRGLRYNRTMSWNYRVIRRPDGLGIHEVYYSEDGRPISWTQDTVEPYGDSPEELRADLEHMLRALDKPILVEDGARLVQFTHT
jgi:hypothetical protein